MWFEGNLILKYLYPMNELLSEKKYLVLNAPHIDIPGHHILEWSVPSFKSMQLRGRYTYSNYLNLLFIAHDIRDCPSFQKSLL